MSAHSARIRPNVSVSRWREIKRLFHAAMDLQSDARERFLRETCDDHEIAQQVKSLLVAHDSAASFISQPALVEAGLKSNSAEEKSLAESVVGKQIGHYEIIRELGRGGMGAVFLANRADVDFNRQVALKIIKRGMDTDAILKRFLIERRILANLQHPNIASFLDGGSTDDGLPFFVMEYVDGESIINYCDTHTLNITERLKLFQKACAAVRYAHQNLVVHRDLKPSNILITSEGIPKLVDFGIAKMLSADFGGVAERTETGLRVMTPRYASPEQIRGLPITTATDVYSLGVILYELLSGIRPFRFLNRTPDEGAIANNPLPPSEAVKQQIAEDSSNANSSSINIRQAPLVRSPRELRGDLDNIVLKALRQEPERRYASAFELSEDIGRHLNGLPVIARADTFSYRAGKFVRRHRSGVAMAAVLLLTLITATSVTSWQAHVARREHANAEQRMVEERKLASSLISEVQKSLKDVPHSLTAQRMLAQKSLEYLNNLAKDAQDNPEYLSELAEAYRNLGYLQVWTLQDNPSALISYDRGIELCRQRLAIQPENTSARLALAVMLGSKVESLRLMQRGEDAAETFAKLLNVQQQLLERSGSDPGRMMTVAETTEAFGEVLQSIDRDYEAKAKFQAALELGSRAVELARIESNTPEQRVDLALMQEKLGSMWEHVNNLKAAEQTFRDAVATASAVHLEHPELIQGLRNTTSSHWFLGMILDREGDHHAALENYRMSLKTIRDAEAADASVDPPRTGEIKYSVVVGRALCKLGQPKEGIPLLHHGVDLTLRSIESDEGNREGTYYGSEVLTWAVQGLAAAGLIEEAKNISMKVIQWDEAVVQGSREDGGPRLRLALMYEQLGDSYAAYDADAHKVETTDRTRLTAARGWYEKALADLRELESFQISKPIVQRELDALQARILVDNAALGSQ